MELSQVIVGAAHLGIHVPDIDRAVAFYEKKLGFRLIHRKVVVDTLGSALEAAFMQLGNLMLELIKTADCAEAGTTGVWNHYAIDAPSFDESVQLCRSREMQLDKSTPDGPVYYDGIGAKGVLGVNFQGPAKEIIEICHNCSKIYNGAGGLSGWSHLAITVQNLERSSAFYQKLGFRICDDGCLETPQGTKKILFMELGDFQLEMIETGSWEEQPQKKGVIDHLALEVSDISQTWQICRKEAGLLLTPVIRELSLFEHGVRYLMVEGPDGETIEFCQKIDW